MVIDEIAHSEEENLVKFHQKYKVKRSMYYNHQGICN